MNKLDLGAVTAYAMAVEKGYEGTEEEFAALQAESGNNAVRAETAADRAQQILDKIPLDFQEVSQGVATLTEEIGTVKDAAEITTFDNLLYPYKGREREYTTVGNTSGVIYSLEENLFFSFTPGKKYIIFVQIRNLLDNSIYGECQWRINRYNTENDEIGTRENTQYFATMIPGDGNYYYTEYTFSEETSGYLYMYLLGHDSGVNYHYRLEKAFLFETELNDTTAYYTYLKTIECTQQVAKNEILVKVEGLTNRVESLEKKGTDRIMTVRCIGDSQTGGGVDGGGSYPDFLQEYLPEHTIRNYGNGGETVSEIAWRCGALPLRIEPFTLPADTTSVEIDKKLAEGRSMPRLFVSWANSNPVTVGGVQCYMYSTGVLHRVESGEAETTFDRPVLAMPPEPVGTGNDICVLLMGQNGGFNDLDDYVSMIRSIVQEMPNDQYIIIAPYTKSFITHFDAMSYQEFLHRMYSEFGSHVFDLRSYLTRYGLTDNSLAASPTDETAIVNGEVPPQLYVDQDVHLNDYGLKAHAKGLYLFGRDLGYWA